jgi:MoxR-like ATPase
MRQELKNAVSDLDDVVNLLQNRFVAKDEIIEMLAISAIAQEHLLLAGPPGTGKSELIKRFAQLCTAPEASVEDLNKPYFEYLLTRFTEPNELFGPVDIKSFRDGAGYHRICAGMLPRAEVVFLDEIFKANSAILNALLTILNERTFYNGGRLEPVPLLLLVGATNEMSEDSDLAALYDRFPIRLWSDNIPDPHFDRLLLRGWQQECLKIREGHQINLSNITDSKALKRLYQALNEVDFNAVFNPYREVIRQIRSEGIIVSDRRAVKLLKLIGAAAIRRGRLKAECEDFRVLRHIWNNRAQASVLDELLQPYLSEKGTAVKVMEREPEILSGELIQLENRAVNLQGDIDLADFLHQCERLRRELYGHPQVESTATVLAKLEKLISTTLENL